MLNTNWGPGPVNTNWGPGPVNTNQGLVPVNTNWEQGRRPSKGPGAEKYNYPVLYVILAISHAQSSLVCNDVLILKRSLNVRQTRKE